MQPPGPRAIVAPDHQQAGERVPTAEGLSVQRRQTPSVTKPAEHLGGMRAQYAFAVVIFIVTATN